MEMRGVPPSCDGSCKSVEQRPFRQVFRVPLDGDDPWLLRVGGLRTFDDAVVGPRDRLETGRQIADRLMVAAIHGGRARTQGTLEERPRFDAHGVTARFVTVGHGSRPLAVQILVEGAAEGDVENLNAAADRENRETAGAR